VFRRTGKNTKNSKGLSKKAYIDYFVKFCNKFCKISGRKATNQPPDGGKFKKKFVSKLFKIKREKKLEICPNVHT